jgi:diadenosine tetraphosphatase ApaH/serine/threonine PP2A family protein phosphatase
VCFHGHTHVPVIFEEGLEITLHPFGRCTVEPGVRYFVNVGSVGQPRDRNPQAAFALYDLEEKTIELRRVAYDVSVTQEKIWKARLPTWLGLRLAFGI